MDVRENTGSRPSANWVETQAGAISRPVKLPQGKRAGSRNSKHDLSVRTPRLKGRVLDNGDRRHIRNRLLLTLPPTDIDLLQPNLTATSLRKDDELAAPGQPIDNVYFPETGIVTLLSPGEDGTEVGLIGPEGCVGSSLVLGVDQIPFRARVLGGSEGYMLPACALFQILDESRSVRRLLGSYIQALSVQLACSIYATARFTLEQRLARWLLMAHDRIVDNELYLTHGTLARMLCVRRPGVTIATQVLEGERLIRARRGCITVLDRPGLVVRASGSYGLAEREYERLIGAMHEKRPLLTTAEQRLISGQPATAH